MKRFLSLLLAALVLLSSLAFAENEHPISYQLGSKVSDFTVTLSDGREMTLSKLLETKELVVLNFWASWCGPCQMEFPFMQEAYLKYQDKVEIIALSVEKNDTDEVIAAYQAENGLTALPMGRDDGALSSRFHFQGIPTSVVIDRYGVFCWQETGAITNTQAFETLFLFYLGDGYTKSQVSNPFYSPGPNVKRADPAVLTAALNAAGGSISIANDVDAAVWPFLPTKDGALASTNAHRNDTKAAVHATLSAKAGDVLAFDYTVSSELSMDYLVLEINGALVDIFSGAEAGTYAYAFGSDGDYAVTLAYCKDYILDAGEDRAVIDNLRLLAGEEAAAALAALPTYPRSLAGDAWEIVPVNGRKVIISDASGLYAQAASSFPAYVIGADQVTLSIRIGEQINPKLALISESSTGSYYPLSTLPQTEDGFLLTLPLITQATNGVAETQVTLFPRYILEPNLGTLLLLYASENNLNHFVSQELPQLFPGIKDASWRYADDAPSATDPLRRPDGTAQYTLCFIDQNGDPVANVMAQICDESTCQVLPSDEKGLVTFAMSASPYEVHVLIVPEGYTFDTEKVYVLPENGGQLDIQGIKN